jgi:MscS family membrane protein
MKDFLHYQFLDNSILSYLLCFGSIAFVLVLKRVLSRLIAGLGFRLIRRTSWKFDKAIFVDLLLAPLETFILVMVSWVSLDKLRFPRALEFDLHKTTSRQILDGLGNALMIMAFIWLLLRLVDFVAEILKQKASQTPDYSDNQLVVFFRDFFKVLIGIMGLLLIIHFSFNKDIGALLAGFGIIGAALALAAKESLENLIASFIIFFDKPFGITDLVRVQNITGTVERIGLRSTRIRTDQKTYVTVPNKQMVDSIVDNLSLRSQRRVDLRLELNLGARAAELEALTEGIRKITSHPDILQQYVFLSDITANAFVVQVEYYTITLPIGEFNKLRQDINLQIVRLVESLRMELAGQSTDVRLHREPGT